MNISLYHTIPPEARHPIYPATARSLRIASQSIEDVVQAYVPQADMAIGIQRFSTFLQQEQRYRELAANCQQIWVFGVPDVPLPPIRHITYVPLQASWAAAHEWFVIVNSAAFGVALVATELAPSHPAALPHFQLCLSADIAILDTLAKVLAEGFQAPLVRPMQHDHARQQALFAQVAHRLIQEHELLAEAAARQDRQAAMLRQQIEAQSHEIQALTGLLPRFSAHDDWQNLLITSIQHRVARLSQS